MGCYTSTIVCVYFTVIFSKVAGLPSEGNAPYSIMVLAGMLMVTFFNWANEASNSLIGNIDLVNKVYFPKIILPSATILVSFIDFIMLIHFSRNIVLSILARMAIIVSSNFYFFYFSG